MTLNGYIAKELNIEKKKKYFNNIIQNAENDQTQEKTEIV